MICQHCIITYYHNKMIQSNKCWRLILLEFDERQWTSLVIVPSPPITDGHRMENLVKDLESPMKVHLDPARRLLDRLPIVIWKIQLLQWTVSNQYPNIVQKWNCAAGILQICPSEIVTQHGNGCCDGNLDWISHSIFIMEWPHSALAEFTRNAWYRNSCPDFCI